MSKITRVQALFGELEGGEDLVGCQNGDDGKAD